MRKYQTYKPSGIEWIGETPQHWEVKRIKDVAQIVTGSTPSSSVEEYWDGDITWITPADFNNFSKVIDDSENKITAKGYKSCGTTLLPMGSVILTTRAPIGNVLMAGRELCTNQGCKSLITNKIHPSFLYYLLLISQIELNTLGQGTTFLELSTECLGTFKVPIPETVEQTFIVAYLDSQTQKIDKLITNKKAQVERLRELRQIEINNAVTKGLNPNVPMKDSGIEWLGEIPGHWELKRLKNIVSMKSGDTITSEDISEEGNIPVYGGNGLRGFTNEYTHEGDYILIGRQGALCGNINFASGLFWASEHAVVVTIIVPCNHYWLGQLLHAMNLNQYSQSAAQPGLSVEAILYLKIPIPPKEEQHQIAQYLRQRTAAIDKLIKNTESQILKLHELRKIKIYEAVTGKLRIEN